MEKNKLIEWLKKDWVVIIVCLLALCACVYTSHQATNYSNKCNQHWQEQWEKAGCSVHGYNTFDINYSWWGDYENKDSNKSTKGTG